MSRRYAFAAVVIMVLGPVGIAVGQIDPGLVDGGFEDPASVHVSGDYGVGYWKGDPAASVQAQNGITPFSGDRMLQFQDIDHGQLNTVWPLVDMTPYASVIADGQQTCEATARLNRIAGDATTRWGFQLAVYAYDGSPSECPGVPLVTEYTHLDSDSDPGTWESLTTTISSLPSATTYLAVGVFATRNVENNYEFAGHYADAVTLNVTPEPGALSLLALGASALLRRDRHVFQRS